MLSHEAAMEQYLALTPAYQRWCASAAPEACNITSYTAYLARVDQMLCYIALLYPTFVLQDDLVLRADQIPDDWETFVRQAQEARWSHQDIEYIVNHLHITDLFLNDPDRDAIPLTVYNILADVIADLWRKRLHDTFPQRHFDVGVTNRDTSPEVYAVQG
jgi:hypothetical protein